jgi:hypothetical protein
MFRRTDTCIAVVLGLLLALCALTAAPASGQDVQTIDDLKKSAPRVYVDGEHLDLNFIKTEIQFVNYVRDRTGADVHVLITQQNTGSGGSEYTLSFIGQGEFEDVKNELKYYSNKINTKDESRRGLVEILKLGLTSYVAHTPIAAKLRLALDGRPSATAVEDRWNFWVFSVSANGRLNGEQARTSNSIFGNASVNRTTPASKFRLGLSANLDESRYDYEGYKEESSSKYRSLDGLYVSSLGEHWSLGAYVTSSYSTYSNIAFSLGVQPAVEYNLFPYAESTRRQLRFLYKIGLIHSKYLEQTIYNKMSESNFSHSLSVTLEFTEPWGNAEISLEGSNYLMSHWEYNKFKLSGNLSVRLIKGLSLTVDGRYSMVHDQLALRKGEVSLEELLLRRTELASNYSYQVRIGLSYSFGSVYSNVVNPRFGGGFGGMSGWYY